MTISARLAAEGSVKTTTTSTKPYNTQAEKSVANGMEHSVIQQRTAKRWGLRVLLNEAFDREFLMSYGSLFQIIGPAYEKDL